MRFYRQKIDFTAALFAFISLLSLNAIALSGQDEGISNEKISKEHVDFFESKIRPVLVKNCYGCHSAKTGKARGGLMLDTKDGIRAGGDSGEGVLP